jgi:hypothetical protein
MEDLLGQVVRGVAQRWSGRGSGLWGKRSPTFPAELGLWLIRKSALGTRHPEESAAFVAKLQTLRILKATARAVHEGALRHGSGAAGVRAANVSMRATDIGIWDGVSVLQAVAGVKRKARDGGSGGSGRRTDR